MPKFLPQELIAIKRDGGALDTEQIAALVGALGDGSLADAQAGAFAMAVFLNGMQREEAVALTLAMRASGRVLDWDLPGPVVDKHSTGGVGDTVSLILAPLAASVGLFVPMISGRGLGHTGGTLDKMASIPGYNVHPSPEQFARTVQEAGCAIIGQTADLAPADGRLYAIRDISSTVESVPLITASILSKKLAAGLDALVMDVKVGNGAFMKSSDDAMALAQSLVSVAEGAGCTTRVLFTDMNQTLAQSAGTMLEVKEALALLSGQQVNSRLRKVTIELVADMLLAAGLVETLEAGRQRATAKLDDGSAAEVFARLVAALGGPTAVFSTQFEEAPVQLALPSPSAGVVSHIDTFTLGMSVVALGGGRRRPDDAIDSRVGLSEVVTLGQSVQAGDPLLVVHAADDAAAAEAVARLTPAFTIRPSLDAPLAPLFPGRLTAQDIAAQNG